MLPERGSIYFDTMLRGVCPSEDCVTEFWIKHGIQGQGSPTVKFRAPTGQHERTPTQHTREQITQRVHNRRNEVARYFNAGLSVEQIAAATSLKRWQVNKDLLALGLEYVDERKAEALALPANISWTEGAKIVGVPRTTFFYWMREAGRKPPERNALEKSKARQLAREGKTQKQIALMLGRSTGAISNWLRDSGDSQLQLAAMES